jgi:tetratricopeptide (TPR) repeat protein
MMTDISRAEVMAGYSQLIGLGRLSEAERLLRDRIGTDNDWVEIRLALAELLAGTQRLDEALTLTSENVSNFPASSLSWYSLGILRQATNQSDGALLALIRAQILAPGSHDVCSRLAPMLAKKPNGTNDLRVLEWSVFLDPGSPDPRMLLAKHWLALGNQQAGVTREAMRAFLLAPGSGEAAYLNGLANVAQLSHVLAVRFLRWAQKAAPTNASVTYHLGNSAFLAALPEISEPAARDALRLGYPEASARFLLARILRAAGRYKEAEIQFAHASELDPRFVLAKRMVDWTVKPEHFQA